MHTAKINMHKLLRQELVRSLESGDW